MLFAIGAAVGLGVGFALLVMARRRSSSSEQPTWPGWTALGLGVAAVVLFAIGVLGAMDTEIAIVPSIALPFAGITFGAGRLIAGDRSWRSWVGVALAGVPTLSWIALAVAELVTPH